MRLLTRTSTLIAAIVVIAFAISPARSRAAERNFVVRLEIKGIIGQGVQNYVQRGIGYAEKRGASAVLITIDTPGGLLDSMKNTCTAMQNTDLPIIYYVSPNGATATSAGFFLLMCSDVAAMAPDTSTGSAHPVSGEGQEMDKTMAEKVTNYSVSYMKTLTDRRGRNTKFAEDAIRESKSITANDALKQHVVEIVADNEAEVLQKADGMSFRKNNKTITAHTAGAEILPIGMSFSEKFIHTVGNPNIAYVLFIVGVYALIFEVTHPGAVVPGIAGVACLVTAFVAFSVLPVNAIGIVMIIGAFVLFLLEIKAPTHGLLTAGGIALFFFGSLFLINTTQSDLGINLGLIIGLTLASVFIIVVALAFIIKTFRNKVVTGVEGLIGAKGKVKTPLDPEGKVHIHGELWTARSEGGARIEQGAQIEVISVDGMELTVRQLIQGGK